MIISIEEIIKQRNICEKTNKHKFRRNKFGVVWCIRCGYLGGTFQNCPDLNPMEKLIVKIRRDEAT